MHSISQLSNTWQTDQSGNHDYTWQGGQVMACLCLCDDRELGQQHALQLVHGLGIVENILDQTIGFVLNKLAAVLEGDHASTVLPAMLQHEQTFIQLSICWSLSAQQAVSQRQPPLYMTQRGEVWQTFVLHTRHASTVG